MNELTSPMHASHQDGIRAAAAEFEGVVKANDQLPGHVLIVESPDCVFSIALADIVDRQETGEDRARVWVRPGAQAYRMSAFTVGLALPFSVAMEDLPPPLPRADAKAPKPGEATASLWQYRLPQRGLINAGAAWTNSCFGGDVYANNCAHFLSDAFIAAGYAELTQPSGHIAARCPAKRPIRARNMWSWFKSQAVTTSHAPEAGTGWWAVFQLNEAEYWGGHVALFDSDSWNYFGTGWYSDWDQYMYQW